MALSTFESLSRGVLLRCPTASLFLARQWVSFAFRQIQEKRAWSWLVKEGQFLFPAIYDTGSVAVTNASTTVTGTGTVWTAGMVTRQFRTSAGNPIYTIVAVDAGAQTLTLDQAWGGADATLQGYQIWRAYVTVPSDFYSFLVVIDTLRAYKLGTDIGQDELDAMDPQRSSSGQPWGLSYHDTSDLTATPPLQRYEVWPYIQQQYVLTYLYVKRHDDLEDSGASLPRTIPGNIVLEGAMAECARWPGPSTERKNPYFNLGLADRTERQFQINVAELMRQDEEIMMQNVRYQDMMGMGFAPASAWWQSHQPAPW